MVKAAHSQQLQQLFETHLEETEAQIERLEECFGILGIQPRAKACKGNGDRRGGRGGHGRREEER